MALFALLRRATPVARERAPTGVLADHGDKLGTGPNRALRGNAENAESAENAEK
jgi:hypothetical protein